MINTSLNNKILEFVQGDRENFLKKILKIDDLRGVNNPFLKKGLYYLINENNIPITTLNQHQHKVRLFLKTVVEHELDPLISEIYLLAVKNQGVRHHINYCIFKKRVLIWSRKNNVFDTVVQDIERDKGDTFVVTDFFLKKERVGRYLTSFNGWKEQMVRGKSFCCELFLLQKNAFAYAIRALYPDFELSNHYLNSEEVLFVKNSIDKKDIFDLHTKTIKNAEDFEIFIKSWFKRPALYEKILEKTKMWKDTNWLVNLLFSLKNLKASSEFIEIRNFFSKTQELDKEEVVKKEILQLVRELKIEIKGLHN